LLPALKQLPSKTNWVNWYQKRSNVSAQTRITLGGLE